MRAFLLRGSSGLLKTSSILRPSINISVKPKTSLMGLQKQSFSSSSSLMSTRTESVSHIVVGAGSAGCVLANRLTEDSSNSVLLLEAGPRDTLLGSYTMRWTISMPAALMYNLCHDKFNWYYETEPQPQCDNRRMYWPRGRVWGGSSSLNAMVYIRGNAKDYDRWARETNAKHWNYQGCLPYFKKAQTHSLGPNLYRGGDGPLHVSRRNWDNPLHGVFLEAAGQAGHPLTEDVNGYQQEGFGYFDMTIYKGKRWNTASAYLRPALNRPNLSTEEQVLVRRILFDNKKAVGIEFEDKKGNVVRRMAEKEVIVSAGAINSPQLLMLSGIGDADHLRDVGIDVVQHVPGVGKNLQDHLEMYIAQKCSQPVTLLKYQRLPGVIKTGLMWFIKQAGPARSAHLESGGFLKSRPDVESPDIMFHFLPSQVIDHGRVAPTLDVYQVHVGPMRPTSRGEITLKSKDPRQHPRIDPKYLDTEIDRWEMRESIRLSRTIFAQRAFDAYRDIELEPGSDAQSDKDLDKFIRAKADSAYHPSCTCKMGDLTKDNMAVVDDQGRVAGVEGLRVVDASVMPSIASGNLNAPTTMLAEKMADLIRGKSPLPPLNVPVYPDDPPPSKL